MARRRIAFEREAPRGDRGEEAAEQHAGDRDDAEAQRKSRGEHDVLHRVGERRDEGKRGDRHRLEIVCADVAGGEPSGGDQQSHAEARSELAARLPERRMRQREKDESTGNQNDGGRAACAASKPNGVEECGQRVGGWRDARPLQEFNARRREQAAQCRLCRDAERDDDDERTEIAAPEQYGGARATAVRQHHAVTEDQSAREHQRHGERRLQINRCAEIDETGGGERLRRHHRGRHRQRVAADAAAVAVVPPVAQAGEQAEAAQQSDHAVSEADQESANQNESGAGKQGDAPKMSGADVKHPPGAGKLSCAAAFVKPAAALIPNAEVLSAASARRARTRARSAPGPECARCRARFAAAVASRPAAPARARACRVCPRPAGRARRK